jgi:small subunit ribosomal protein S4
MARYRGPRLKICRALGVDLPGLTTKIRKEHRQHPPGVHGAGRRGKPSDYKIRLQEKQKLRFHFGVGEKQFRKYMSEAARRKGPTGENLITLLERRLDNVIWRLGFAPTIPAARQMVVHGHITLNGHKVDRPSYQIKDGMTIQIREKSLQTDFIRSRLEEATHRNPPEYLERDLETASGKMTQRPTRNDLPFDVDLQQVVEYYSQML